MSERTLILLRHAKAETPGDRPDFERELTDRGRSDADAAGAWLADEGLRPKLVICSSAARTRQTWQGVSVALRQANPELGGPEVLYQDGLYNGGRTAVVDALRRVQDDVPTVLVIGHNPTVSDVSILLRPDPDAFLDWEGLKTSGLAVHRPDNPWAGPEPGSFPFIREHTARG